MSNSKVSLVACTIPVIEDAPEIDSAEDFIAYAARVSNPANQLNTETSGKLLQYLMKNHHWSPFEMVSVTLEINTTRDIARQILRHRSFSFQEFSQRYADASQLGYTLREARTQDTKNRQNSNETDDELLKRTWEQNQENLMIYAGKIYEDALKAGIAMEVARSVLPEGLTNSRLYMAGTLRSWIHYLQLRTGNGTQKEHREVAQACLEVLKGEFPNILGALEAVH